MCKQSFAYQYLVSVIRGGKVVKLEWCKRLSDLRVIKLHHMAELHHLDCEFEVMPLPFFSEEYRDAPFSRNGKPPNRVKCLDTGEVYETIMTCSMAMHIPERNIRESIRRGVMAYGYHFRLLPPIQRLE